MLFHHRTADTASDAGAHFNKASVDPAGFDLFKRGDTVFNAVYGEIGIICRFLRHCLQNAARCWKESREAFFCLVKLLLQGDILCFQPVGEFLKSQRCIHDISIVVCLIFFGNAGTDKHCFSVGNALFNILAVRLHGREHVSEIGQT